MTINLTGWVGLAAEDREFLRELEKFVDYAIPDGSVLSEWNHDLVKRCADLGLQSILIDDDENLDESRVRIAMAASEVVASRSPALAMTIGCARIHSIWLAVYAPEAVRTVWLQRTLTADAIGSMAITEAGAGTDVRAITTTASQVDGGWRLRGEKAWMTLGPVSNYSFVLAKIGDSARESEMGVFFVERGWDGVTYGQDEGIAAFNAVPVGGLHLDDVFVPDDHVVATSGGFGRAMTAVNYARMEAACLGVGILQASADAALRYSMEREAFGKPIGGHQAIQISNGRTAIDLEAARSLLAAVANLGLEGVDPAASAAAKAFATEAALAAASRTVSTMGANGLVAGGRPMQMFQDAKAAQIFDGTTDILYSTVAKSLQRRVKR